METIDIENLRKELLSYKIPSDPLELMEWIDRGDKNSTKENWNFFKGVVLSLFNANETYRKVYSVLFDYLIDWRGNISLEKNVPSMELSFRQFLNGQSSFVWQEMIEFFKKYNDDSMCYLSAIILSNNKYLYKSVMDYREEVGQIEYKLDKLIEEKIIIEKVKSGELGLNYLSSDIIEKLKIKGFKTKRKTIKAAERLYLELEKNIESLSKELNDKSSSEKAYIASCIEEFASLFYSTYGEKENSVFKMIIDNLKRLSQNSQINAETLCFYIKRLFCAPGIIKSSYDASTTIRKKFAQDLRSNILLAGSIYCNLGKLSSEKDFEKLCFMIRSIFKRTNPDGINITEKYRNTKIKSNNGFISGSELTGSELQIGMQEIGQKFGELSKIEDIETYVRRATDIFQDFIRLHPYRDGNGRTSVVLLLILLAKRNIYIPSLYDTYFDKIREDSIFKISGDEAAITDTYDPIEDYIIDRVQEFYPNLIKRATVESMKKIAEKEDGEGAKRIIDELADKAITSESEKRDDSEPKDFERSL